MADRQPVLVALDQGTTSTRALLFDMEGRELAVAQRPLRQIYPRPGWVEHDPEEIWTASREVLAEIGGVAERHGPIAALGLTNQRETTVLWDRATGRPVHNAIVWQDRRTAAACEALRAQGQETAVTAKTGLLFDPYFSATKLAWLLDQGSGLRARAETGELAFGTIDSFLLWRLSGGKAHVTDATNAGRTLLFNIHTGEWDDDLLRLFRIPRALLPEVRDSAGPFTTTDLLGGSVTIAGVAGDQQAALVGQACFAPGEAKATFGTGCFMLLNTGADAVQSRSRLLTTPAYRLNGAVTYALEGSLFMAGAIVQWLRDGLKLFRNAEETEALAAAADPARAVTLVPAFTGLGAPYWDAEARGAILGLTRDVGIAEIVRAGLEAVSFQMRDLVQAVDADRASAKGDELVLRVDGGMVANQWFLQNLADITGRRVERAACAETTALGAAFLAGLGVGLYGDLGDLKSRWRAAEVIEPRLSKEQRDARYQIWQDAVARVRSRPA